MTATPTRRILLALLAACVTGTLAGCGMGTSAVSIPTQITGSAISGVVHGGQQPVAGSTIQLYAAPAYLSGGGYGSAAIKLGGTTATTASGNFNLASYTCPSASTPIYLTATGGNSGYTNNPNLLMVAALGPCGSLPAFIAVNEVTTIAAAYALSPFASGPAAISVPATNQTGLANAFADTNTLVNIANGTAPGTGLPTGTTVPTSEINTLADILAACVNSSGGTAGDSTSCGKLFTATTVGGVSPTDTFTAALAIAQHPSANIAALFALSSATAPFQPTLASAPNDFTLAVSYASAYPSSALAADASGNIWITNTGFNAVTALSHSGLPLAGSPFTGFNGPSAVAIATDGTIWVTNLNGNNISRLSSSGAPIAGSPYSGGGINNPSGIAFDNFGNAWTSNQGNSSVSKFSPSGVPLSPATGYTAATVSAYITNPLTIAINPH